LQLELSSHSVGFLGRAGRSNEFMAHGNYQALITRAFGLQLWATRKW